jgi:predicted Zn-dependent protease
MSSSVSTHKRLVVCALTCGLLLASAPAPAADDVEPLVAARYPNVLQRFAAGEHDRALSDLAGLENQIAAGPPNQLDKLWKAKLHVLRDLIDDAEVLVPVIQLHHDAFLAYRAEGKTLLARHSRTMAAELSDIYADRANSDAARVLAARAVASLGGYQQEDGSIGSASELFVQALKLDPTCAAALLGQASMFEKLGQYEPARDYLERLLASDKKNPQARLRLALNLARTKDVARARQILDGLVKEADSTDPQVAWVYSLAYQEQARLLVDAGSAKTGADLLRKGSERFPQSGELLIARAYLLERAGDGRGAQELAGRVAALAKVAGEHDAPRWLYNRWPQVELDEARKRLAESTTPRLRRLQAALQGESEIITTVEGH